MGIFLVTCSGIGQIVFFHGGGGGVEDGIKNSRFQILANHVKFHVCFDF